MIIRKATMDERDALQRLIAESARKLSREHYSDAQIEAAIATVFGVDTTLIEDGTYFVVESDGEPAVADGVSGRLFLAAISIRRETLLILIRKRNQQRYALSLFIPLTHAKESRVRSFRAAKTKRERRAIARWSCFQRFLVSSFTNLVASSKLGSSHLISSRLLLSTSFPCAKN